MKNIKVGMALAATACALLLTVFNNCGKVSFGQSPAAAKQDQVEFLSTSALMINGGAPYTNNQIVQLTLDSPRATNMQISNLADCSDGNWETYSSAKLWTLSKTDAVVSVYAKYKALDGTITPCISASIMHDDVAPQAMFSTAPGVFTNAQALNVAWLTLDNLSGVATVTCTDPSGASHACADQINAMAANEGPASLKVSVVDKAGNVSPDFIYSWVFDKTPPVVSINSQPAALTSSGSAVLTFSATDSNSGIAQSVCSLDGSAFAACSSPANYASLGMGAHSFQVKATDRAGNISSVASANWTVDMTAPSIEFTQTPSPFANSSAATFAFDGMKNGQPITSFQCHLDSAALAACTSPDALTGLSEGTHSFEFRGIDAIGNASSPLKYTWVVDLTLPTITFTQVPNALGNSASANFQWNSADSLSGVKVVECRMDNAAYAACPGSKSLSGLAEGAHKFDVRVTDNAGNVATASRSWTIDLTAPAVQILTGPGAFTANIAAAFTFTATDSSGVAAYECHVDNGTFSACTSPYMASNLAEGGHVFYVRATDKAGNVSTAATYSWTLDLSPPIIQIVSAPSSLKTTDHAVIQYKVIDLASGVANVKCGLTVPLGSVADCQTTATVDLGTFPVGSYGFSIQTVDNVGNAFNTVVNFQVTAVPLVCDPFTVGGDALCNGGLVGNIYYLDSAHQTTFQGLATKTVDYFIQSGTKENVILNLRQLFVSTRSFTAGFPTNSGSLVQDNSGNPLYSYFAFDLKTVYKLDPVNNQPGWYQFATLSDDGSVVNITPQGTGATQNLIASDGDHSTRMGCSTQAIYIDDTTRLAMEIKYYQGPPTEIALVLMWKRVTGPTDALDVSCGVSGNNAFFGAPPYTDYTTGGYGQLLSRGWQVSAATNFIAPP